MLARTGTIAFLLAVLAGPLPAQITTDDIGRNPAGGGGGRGSTGAGARGTPASFLPPAEPTRYDIALSVSDRTLNRVAKAVVDAAAKKAKPGAKKLEQLTFAFDQDSTLTLSGAYSSPASANTREGKFQFTVRSKLAFPNPNDLSLSILSARVTLNGVSAFESRPDNPGAIAAWLDFFSPSITRGANKAMSNVETAMARRLGQEAADVPLHELVAIRGNQIDVHILPTILSPLFPPLNLTWVKIEKGKLNVKGDFK